MVHMRKVELTRELLEKYRFGLYATSHIRSSRVLRGDVARVTSYGLSGRTYYAVLGISMTRYILKPFSLTTALDVVRWEEHVEYSMPAEIDDDGMLVIHLPWKNVVLLPPSHTTQDLESRMRLDAPIGINN